MGPHACHISRNSILFMAEISLPCVPGPMLPNWLCSTMIVQYIVHIHIVLTLPKPFGTKPKSAKGRTNGRVCIRVYAWDDLCIYSCPCCTREQAPYLLITSVTSKRLNTYMYTYVSIKYFLTTSFPERS